MMSDLENRLWQTLQSVKIDLIRRQQSDEKCERHFDEDLADAIKRIDAILYEPTIEQYKAEVRRLCRLIDEADKLISAAMGEEYAPKFCEVKAHDWLERASCLTAITKEFYTEKALSEDRIDEIRAEQREET
jgi:hypothetical protein